MSYDITIADHDFNYTWNVGKLFYDHIPAVESERGGLHELHGLTGKQAVKVLSDALDRIHNASIVERGFLDKYDPSNGWGSTYGATLFLARILAACAENPRHKVSLWT